MLLYTTCYDNEAMNHTYRRIVEAERHGDPNDEASHRNKRRRIEDLDCVAHIMLTSPLFFTALPLPKNYCVPYTNPFEYMGKDVMSLIIAHLFTTPLYFNGALDGASETATTKYYRPSYANRLSMKDLNSLLRTCHYINKTIGAQIRRNKPIPNRRRCRVCNTGHKRCKDCRAECCLTCNATEMIHLKCPSCTTTRYLCPCRGFLLSYPGVPCTNCATVMDRYNVTHRPFK